MRRGLFNLWDCLPESLIFCPNKLFSNPIKLQLLLGQAIVFSEEIARTKYISDELGGGGLQPYANASQCQLS